MFTIHVVSSALPVVSSNAGAFLFRMLLYYSKTDVCMQVELIVHEYTKEAELSHWHTSDNLIT